MEDDPVTHRSERQYTEELTEVLDRAVKRRLVADVPVGLFSSAAASTPASSPPLPQRRKINYSVFHRL